jgi:hypothetical protein
VLPVLPVLPVAPGGPAGPGLEQALKPSIISDATIKFEPCIMIPSMRFVHNGSLDREQSSRFDELPAADIDGT